MLSHPWGKAARLMKRIMDSEKYTFHIIQQVDFIKKQMKLKGLFNLYNFTLKEELFKPEDILD